MLADYRAGTLRYHELIVFSRATARGMVVSHIYVDSEESLRGGRAVWGLPKELAEFELAPGTFAARQGGQVLLSARIRRRPGRMPLLIPAPVVSEAGATLGRAGSAPPPRSSPSTSRPPARSPRWGSPAPTSRSPATTCGSRCRRRRRAFHA